MSKIQSISNTKKKNRTLLIYTLCLILGVVYSVSKSPILGSLTVLLVCLIAFTSISVEENFLLIFGLQFIRVIIPLHLGSSIFGLILPLYIVLIIKHITLHRAIYKEHLLLLFLLFLDIMISAINGIFKVGDNVNWVFSLMYVVYILKLYADKIDFEKLFLFFLMAQWTICIVNILAELQIFGRSLVPNMYGVWTTQLNAFAFGKAYSSISGGNGISFNNALAVCMCILMLPKAKNMILRMFYVLSIAFLGYCGILVIGRGFYVEIILFVCLLLASNIKKPTQMILYFSLILLIAGLIYYFAKDYILISIERVFERFDQGYGDRADLVSEGQRLLQSNISVLLFGAGSYYPDTYGFTAHNLYLDSIVSLGIIGGFIYWSLIASTIYKTIKRNAKFTIMGCIPLIMLFVFKYISGSTRDVGFYYYIAFGVLFAIYSAKGVKPCEKNYSSNSDL